MSCLHFAQSRNRFRQIFLAWRVKRLIKARWGWFVFGLIAICSITAGIFGFYMATQLLRFVRTQAGYTPYVEIANTWTATSTVTDVLIAYGKALNQTVFFVLTWKSTSCVAAPSLSCYSIAELDSKVSIVSHVSLLIYLTTIHRN